MPGEFVGALRRMRRRTRERMEGGREDSSREVVLKLLDDALATENLCVLRHKRQGHMAEEIHSPAVAGELRRLANRERAHAERIAARIVQLGGVPGWCPGTPYGRYSDHLEDESLEEMIYEDVIAEQIAMESYADIIDYIGDCDPRTRSMLEDIVSTEAEHAEDLVGFLPSLDSEQAHTPRGIVVPMRRRREH
jgi:bacterioferritin